MRQNGCQTGEKGLVVGGEREEGHLENCLGRAPLLSFTSADDHLAQQQTTRSPNIIDSSLLIPTANESYWLILFMIFIVIF